MPLPEFSPYSLLSASATCMPETTRPMGTKPCSSCVADRSLSAMYICVVRPFATANAKATVPRTFDSFLGSSGIVLLRHASATFGLPLIPNCAQRPATTRKKRLSSKYPLVTSS